MNRKQLTSGTCALTLLLLGAATPALAKGPAAGGHSDGYVFYNDWSGKIASEATMGSATDQVFTGDWNGNRSTSLATRDGAKNTLYNDGEKGEYRSFIYWNSPDVVFTGDWDGDGKTTFGVRDGNTYMLRDTLGNGFPDHRFQFGTEQDLLYVGDPDGKGKDAIVLRNGNRYQVHYGDSATATSKTFKAPKGSEVVGLGDWDGNGTDTPLVRKGTTYYAYDSWDSNAKPTHEVEVGGIRNAVLIGDWDGDGKDTIGLRNYVKPGTGGQIGTDSTTAVVESPDLRLRADAAESWQRVLDTFGQNFPLSAAWRSYDTQKQLFEERYTPKSKGGGEFCDVRTWNNTRYVRISDLGAAAVPGTSNHGKGQAIDVPGFEGFDDATRLKFLALAKDFGWSDKEGCQVNERWHFTYDPAADKGTTNWSIDDPVNRNVSHCPDKPLPVASGDTTQKPQCTP